MAAATHRYAPPSQRANNCLEGFGSMIGRRRRLMFASGAVTVALVAALAGAWYQFLRHDAPPPVSIEAAVAAMPKSGAPVIEANAGPRPLNQANRPSAHPNAATSISPDGITGKWVIAPETETFAGYRIAERVASIEAAEVVGRTSALEGTVRIDGQHLVSVSVTADMTRLKSDQKERDKALETQALETSAYPAAGFELTEPLRLPESLADGEVVTVSARGDLTVHGVTRAVEIPLDAQVSHGMLVVVGSFEITLADYKIDQSTAAFVASIEERALVELQLFFAPA